MEKKNQTDLRHRPLVSEAKRRGSAHTGYREFAFEIQTRSGKQVLKLIVKQ